MVALFRRPSQEGGLDDRIAALSNRRNRVLEPAITVEPAEPASPSAEEPGTRPRLMLPTAPPTSVPPQQPVLAPDPLAAAAVPASGPVLTDVAVSVEDQMAMAREQLTARLSTEIRPERRALLSRGELAKLVDAAVQAYFVRHNVDPNPLARRDLVTQIMQVLLTPAPAETEETAANRRNPHRAAIEAAKAQIRPLVLEHMDVAAAAEMPRPAFEAQLTGWVKELLAETKIQLNFVEQRELVESLIADMLGLGPLEPLMADETVTDIMVNGPKQVYVERRGKLEITEVVFRDDSHLMNVATKIVTRVGRRIDEARPLVDARLADGSRVNIIIPPLALDVDPPVRQNVDHARQHGRRRQHLGGDGDVSQDRLAVPPEHPDLGRYRVGQDHFAQCALAHDRPPGTHGDDRGRGRTSAPAAARRTPRNPPGQP
jgi:Type II/IV secretion system protein